MADELYIKHMFDFRVNVLRLGNASEKHFVTTASIPHGNRSAESPRQLEMDQLQRSGDKAISDASDLNSQAVCKMATMKRASPPGALTRDRIVEAARDLFAEHGVEAVSLRELTSRAGVNLAAIHYHFGTKEGLLAEVFSRSSEPINRWRLELLRKVRCHEDGRPILEDVLDAFLRPALSSGRRQNNTFMRLRARLALERDESVRRILSEAFDESSKLTLETLAKAMPNMPATELYWRFHFLMGSMFYTMADAGRIQALSAGACDPGNVDEALTRLVAIYSRVFRDDTPTI